MDELQIMAVNTGSVGEVPLIWCRPHVDVILDPVQLQANVALGADVEGCAEIANHSGLEAKGPRPHLGRRLVPAGTSKRDKQKQMHSGIENS